MSRDDIELGLKIVTVAVAIFGVLKYFSDRASTAEAERNARSLAYLEAYASPEMVGARQVLFDFWGENRDFVSHMRSEGIDARGYALFAQVSLNEYGGAKELQAALFKLANHYDQIWHCRTAGLCAPEVLDSYFCERAVLQSAAYAPFLADLGRASGYETLGEGLVNYGAICAKP
jgi:hypothetical protein